MRALSICVLLIVFVLASMSGGSLLSTARIEELSRWKAQSDALDGAKLEKTLLEKINARRKKTLEPELQLRVELSAWLDKRGSVPLTQESLQTLLDDVGKALPDYTNIRVQTLTVADASVALPLLETCKAVRGEDMDSLALYAKPSSTESAFDLLLMTGLKTVEFTPENLNARIHPILATTCPSCQSRFALRSFTGGEPCNLVCPECETRFALLVADNQGAYHYVNDFLVGFEPPARFRDGLNRMEEMLQIWRGVFQTCEYKSDSGSDKKLDRDAWQTGPETLNRGVGDCDDTSVLLADWLISRGFNARVALGEAMGEGHAWVVVQNDGHTYLLESTSEPPETADQIGTVSEFAGKYVPEILFDRDACYFWKNGKEPFDNNYFSQKWQRLAQGEAPMARRGQSIQLSIMVGARSGLNRDWMDLAKLSPGAMDWQISWLSLK
ncbi:MAG: hypothetical protein JNJ83_17930 [Verrucomicrobiaceae bacterium]|nr:hypothetical protein [Verrucomicrobiaceae bacterium]